jgi:DNA ligase-1
MPPKSKGTADTPSPAKKRKAETTPVKRGVDFFFKKRVEKNAPHLDEENFDARRKQEEDDERFARSLQDMEGQQEVNDEEIARRLANEYKDDGHEATGEDVHPEPTGDKLPSPPITDRPRVALDTPAISLEDIYAIPLDKDPLAFDPFTDAACFSTWSPQRTPYAFLTHAFILINSTRSRLKIVDYLVNALRVVIAHDSESLLPLVWLTTNAIAPPFAGVELNLGGSVISKALVSASGLTPGALKRLYDKHGDIGDVAFEAKMAVRTLIAPAPLTVTGVYSTLRKIANAKGQGSAETKRRLVERLLVSAKGEEVRYIGRTLVQHVFAHLQRADVVTYWRCENYHVDLFIEGFYVD